MTDWYIIFLCIFLVLVLLVGAFIFVRYLKRRNFFIKQEQSPKAAALHDEFAAKGFFYSMKDDAFYSTKDALQHRFGSCQLYDETMPLIGRIVDCEPITFDYDNKHWLIELWKGQYEVATGCQIGIYCTVNDYIKAPGFQGVFYEAPDERESCLITYTLKKKNKILLRNKLGECFMAGLKLGEFSNPSALSLKVKITFPNKNMLSAFIGGLKAVGYSRNEYSWHFKTVTVHFTKPHTTQPASRTRVQEAIIQQGNYANCQKCIRLTFKCSNSLEKLELIYDIDKELYEKMLNSFYSKGLYSSYELIHPILKKLATSLNPLDENSSSVDNIE